MSQWKVTLPREKPAKGKAHLKLGVMYDNGARFETGGELPEALARVLLDIAIRTRPEQIQAVKDAVDAAMK